MNSLKTYIRYFKSIAKSVFSPNSLRMKLILKQQGNIGLALSVTFDSEDEDPEECLNSYLLILGKIEELNVTGYEYEWLFAHVRIVACALELSESFPDEGEGKSEFERYKEMYMTHAQKCLDILQPALAEEDFPDSYDDDGGVLGLIMRENDIDYEKQLNLTALCKATSTLALDAYYHSEDDKSELEKALELISLGCQYSEGKSGLEYMLMHKTTFLLELGRKEEAFQLIASFDPELENYVELEDLEQRAEYVAWMRRANPDAFSSEIEKKQRFSDKMGATAQEALENYTKLMAMKLPENSFSSELVTFEEAKKRYPHMELTYADYQPEFVQIHKGDVWIDGDLDFCWIDHHQQTENDYNKYVVTLIDGNLTVKGAVLDAGRESYSCLGILWITGDVLCSHLHTGEGFIYIDGNTDVALAITAEGSGYMNLKGTCDAPFMLTYEHIMDGVGGEVYIDHRSGITVNFGVIFAGQLASSEILDPEEDREEEILDQWRFVDHIKKGKNPFPMNDEQ